jgi:hypothetical protein
MIAGSSSRNTAPSNRFRDALLSQTEPRVEVFRCQSSGDWLLSEAVGLEAFCRFESVDSVALSDIYANISFRAEEPVSPEARSVPR